ncbi:MAG: biotin/lipoyl-containing protein [Acidobacteriaceae bacterium]
MILRVEMAGRTFAVDVRRGEAGRIECLLDGKAVELDASLLQPGVASLLVGGRSYECVLTEDPAAGDGAKLIQVNGHRFPFRAADPRSLRGRKSAGGSAEGPRPVKAPMPGRVVRVMVAVGDEVAAQQGVVVIEAMKMQNELKSPKMGRVVRLTVGVGDTVQVGDVLAVVE